MVRKSTEKPFASSLFVQPSLNHLRSQYDIETALSTICLDCLLKSRSGQAIKVISHFEYQSDRHNGIHRLRQTDSHAKTGNNFPSINNQVFRNCPGSTQTFFNVWLQLGTLNSGLRQNLNVSITLQKRQKSTG